MERRRCRFATDRFHTHIQLMCRRAPLRKVDAHDTPQSRLHTNVLLSSRGSENLSRKELAMSIRTLQPNHSHASREGGALFYTAILVGALSVLLLQCFAGAQGVAVTESSARTASS